MPLKFNNIYSHLPQQFYSKVKKEKITDQPILLHFNQDLGKLLDFDQEILTDFKSLKNWVGDGDIAGSNPLAMVYAGHQFGQYVTRLGDGRALLIGQVIATNDRLYDLYLKGSGITPYSRMGDGRAVLRSSIREYLACEAMYNLGIPTTRCLALIATNKSVIRERIEPGAIVIRVAESHIRFGHFEYFHYHQDYENVKILANHVIENYYPHLLKENNKYHLWLEEIVKNTALMIAKWQAIGFCHGVMNTDNMSILGLTLDYGPFGFMESYNPDFICNHSDYSGRYAYNQQPQIAHWNLYALAYALQSLIKLEEAIAIIEAFGPLFSDFYSKEMCLKLGFEENKPEIIILWSDLLKIMAEFGTDYTLTFYDLKNSEEFLKHFQHHEKALKWLERYQKALICNKLANQPNNYNPRYILRNWVAEETIRKIEDKNDLTALEKMMIMLASPFEVKDKYEQYAAFASSTLKNLCVSCSS
jgi:uncharacterized protein YdiU (UPF0061 family)